MIKKTLLILLAAGLLFSCNKKETETTPQFQDVSFTAIQVNPDGGLKSTAEEFDCVENTPDYAHFTIAGIDDAYDAALFELDGVLYTQSIKLPVAAEYCVTEFFLFDDVNGDGVYDDDDVIVFATPEDNSHYGEYVTDGIEYCFPVTAFTKAELQIEVLCFQEAYYTDFGFDWFAVTEIVVRQFCFFGDICITDAMYGAFDNSVYDLDANGLQADEEAQFRVIVSNDAGEVPYSPFDNVAIRGTGEALCVDYPDNLSQVDNFTFELQVWVPNSVGTFVWQTYATFTSTDAGNLYYGTEDLGDNTTVKSFAVGDCSPMSNPIFAWLPAPPCDPFQGFEENTDGWDLGYGVATRVASGTDGIPAAAGNYFAYFAHDVTNDTGPFTRFCGYTCEWTGTWMAEVDVYLDTEWAAGEGFDFSVAANGSDCNHQRDFIFHVGMQTNNELMVAGSNNTNFGVRMDLGTLDHYTVTTSGWYTLQAVFNDVAGVLSVDLNLLDNTSTVLFTETRTTPADQIPAEVGGHRYAWFTVIDVAGGLAVDNTDLAD